MFSAQVVAEIRRVAEQNGVEPAALLAVADVESAGTAFWTVGGRQVPPVRPEGHYFYRLTSGATRLKAVHAGLASPKAGAIRVPASWAAVYAMVERMKAIDEKAALASCSWGLGQVMGDNWHSLGFTSVQELVEHCNTVEGQVDLMWRFIKKNHLDDEIARRDWRGFAKGYNGPRSKPSYAADMGRAYSRYLKAVPVVAPNNRSRAGIADPEIKDAQTQLMRLGYFRGPADGLYDEPTREAIRKYQVDAGLVPDGQWGKMTRDALRESVSAHNKAQGDKLVTAGIGTGGADAAIDKINDSTSSLQWLAGGNDYITYLLLGLTLLTVGLVLWGLWKKFRS